MASDSISISPARLRYDLYGFVADDVAPRTPLVISVLASLLERAIARNERHGGGNAGPDDARARIFECSRVLDMSIDSFLERIFRYAHVSPPIYVVAYVYMDRLRRSNPGFRIVSTNVHRILTASVMVASKFVEDINYPNSYFAKIGGLETEELNRLEVEFLFLMGFKLNVSVSVFESYCSHLEREVSFGGGYQIERCLMKSSYIMCSGEITSEERKRSSREWNQLARSVP